MRTLRQEDRDEKRRVAVAQRNRTGYLTREEMDNVYSESWWDERVNALSRAVAAVFAAPAAQPPEPTEVRENTEKRSSEWVPFWVPQPKSQPQAQP